LLMDLTYLLRGLAIGFSIAAPVGPIGVLCIRRTLAEGRASGLLSGLGAATADGIYGVIAGFGLTYVSNILIGYQSWIRLIGGLFLCYLGLKTYLSRPAESPAWPEGEGLAGAYASTFLLTLTNPMTILAFTAIFAGLGIGSAAGDYASATLLVMGVFCGSAAWWLILSSGVSLLSSRFSPRALGWVNKVAGIIILGFGVTALLSLVG
jgi:threonine/homoserine/homoserine lactone efflux protein